MRKSLRTIIFSVGAILFAASMARAGQTPPTPAPDTGTPAPQHHAKAGKGKKHSGKKGGHKKGRKKSTSTDSK
jgi:hypothetical protein